MLTYKELQKNEDVRTYVAAADATLGALGFTEHSFGHVTKVAASAKYILETLGYSEHEVELAQIAAFLHDIGNLVNRRDHAYTGGVMAFRILDKLGFSAADTALVVSAIGNHDETGGLPVNAVAAALILADKSDVRRSRVRNVDEVSVDIHDRVNYSVTESSLTINEMHSEITLSLTIDTTISSVMEYFEIFLERMLLCKKAASALGLEFNLVMNRQEIL
ncbi:MAG: HD domain-containing protein [Clostridia bacterium]|nr:HD domain-containing protein [Clostridia bacterium]